MDGILRFPGGVRRDTAIESWFKEKPEELRSIAQPWFERMRECGNDVVELLHDGHPTACVGDAAFGYVNIFTNHANVGFFHGASLKDPHGLLEGTGKRMRHVKLKPGTKLDSSALNALIVAAYRDIKERL